MNDRNMSWEDECRVLKQRCVVLENACAAYQCAVEDWRREAERWRKVACGNQCAVEKVHPEKSVLSAWKNYDHTAEIEAVRDEMERTQKVISEKERELERKSQEKEVCGNQEVGAPHEAKNIIEGIFADLPEKEECGEAEVKPDVVINIYL